jgi:hypothetical protein
MATTARELREWFDAGKQKKAAYMIVVCDTFDWEDYPVYVGPNQNVQAKVAEYDGRNMQRIMEVYDLTKPWPRGDKLVRADR